MAACCGNCRYAEYKEKEEFHFGTVKGEHDWWCAFYGKWLGTCSGKCSNYDED